MSLILILEDGQGRADANSYASVEQGDAYHEGHLYGTAWTSATNTNKEKALVMATRLIDASYFFHGTRVETAQALSWPRECVVNPEQPLSGMSWLGGSQWSNFPSDEIPEGLVHATCEMARELLLSDRTAPPPGEGVSVVREADLSSITYDKADTRELITAVAQLFLKRLGVLIVRRFQPLKLQRT